MTLINKFKNNKGEINVMVVFIVVCLIIFLLPLLSIVHEKLRINLVKNDTTYAVETSLISALSTLNIEQASAEIYDFNSVEFKSVFQEYLALNMNLSPELSKTKKSLVDGDVTIIDIKYYGTESLPYTNLNTGEVFTRPYFNVVLDIIIAPSLFRTLIQEVTGVDEYHFTYYDDVSMPVDN